MSDSRCSSTRDRLDCPSRSTCRRKMGLDSDSSRALGEVGRAGVAIDSVEDMHALLEGIPLDQVSTSMTINATAATLLAMYIVVAEERGIARGS